MVRLRKIVPPRCADDSGLVVETKEAAAASAQTLTLYYVETNTGKYEAARIAP